MPCPTSGLGRRCSVAAARGTGWTRCSPHGRSRATPSSWRRRSGCGGDSGAPTGSRRSPRTPGAADAAAATLAALAQGNVTYEERFGHVFLISATGKTGDEMLGALRGRLSNDPATELRVAAEEQAKITRLRLDKLVAS